MATRTLKRARRARGAGAPRSFVTIALVCALYGGLLLVDGLRASPSHLLGLAQFGFALVVGVLYLLLGSLVWLYARSRATALLLYGGCAALACSFAVQTAAVAGDPLLSAVGDVTSTTAVLCFAWLALVFPRNRLSAPGGRGRLLRGWAALVGGLGVVAASAGVASYVPGLRLPASADLLYYGYYFVALTSIVLSILLAYRSLGSRRERQQLRLFTLGAVLSFAPLLLLTVLPDLLRLPPQFVVSGQASTLPLVLLPLALGYSILRYQILVPDRYIRRAVSVIIVGVGLAVLGYIVSVAVNLTPLAHNRLAMLIGITLAMAVLGSLQLGLANVVTARLFAHRAADQLFPVTPGRLPLGQLDLQKVSALLAQSILDACEAREAALFVRSEQSLSYRLTCLLQSREAQPPVGKSVAARLLERIGTQAEGESGWIAIDHALIGALARVSSPTRVGKLLQGNLPRPERAGARIFTDASPEEAEEPLLVPVHLQGDQQPIALLALGARLDGEPYAGPDFEDVDDVLAQFAQTLEMARRYAEVRRRRDNLLAFYARIMREQPFQSSEDVALAYAQLAAKAASPDEANGAVAQVWLLDGGTGHLQMRGATGSALHLAGGSDRLTPSSALDWEPWFFPGKLKHLEGARFHQSPPPPCLTELPGCAVAWLPLQGKNPLGLLALLYPSPHAFTAEEQQALLLFANQCAEVMEGVIDMQIQQHALERQHTREYLSEQFLQESALQLWTPLSVIQGYIELLRTYQHSFPSELQEVVLQNASGVSREATQLIDQILAVSRLLLSPDRVGLSAAPLQECISQSIALLQELSGGVHPPIAADIPADLLVLVERERFRQVLLHLLTNAFKYAPSGSPIEISCEPSATEVTVRMRDSGLGAASALPERPFERFMGAERHFQHPLDRTELSLFLCKQFIEDMGGRMWVERADLLRGRIVVACTLQRAGVARLQCS